MTISRKYNKLIKESWFSSIVVKFSEELNDVIILRYYEGDLYDMIDMDGYDVHVDMNKILSLKGDKLETALDRIIKHELYMSECEIDCEERIEENLEEMREKIAERENNRRKGDNTVYADDAWEYSIRHEGLRHIRYLMGR